VSHEVDALHGWVVLAASVSVAVNMFLFGAFMYHRSTIRNYKAALIQWQRWGVQMRRNLGWTDSYLRTRVKNMTLNTRTRVWKAPTGAEGNPLEAPPLPPSTKTPTPRPAKPPSGSPPATS
jgi:hypothetical protein